MFCPVCKAEFRYNVIVCPECCVELVPRLPEGPQEAEDPLVPMWQCDDPRVLARGRERLEQAGIPFVEGSAEDYPLTAWMHRRYELRVPWSRREEAVKALYETPEDDVPAADQSDIGWKEHRVWPESSNPADSAAPAWRPYPPEDWDPAEATAEVWRGDEITLAELIAAALRENGIGSRIGRDSWGVCVRVHPVDDERAQPIVRQAVEGTPPAEA